MFPITHVGGVGWLIAGLLAGFAHIAVPIFDARRTMPLLARHGVTLAGAGTVFHRAYLAAGAEVIETIQTLRATRFAARSGIASV